MDETKQNDQTNRGETGPTRIHQSDEGEVADIICASGHAYQVVYPQESTWVLYLRLATIDGNYIGIVRVVLGPGSLAAAGGSGDSRWDFYPGVRERFI